MYQNLKGEIKEIIEIVKECPEGLQEKCFELLLENYLASRGEAQVNARTTPMQEETNRTPQIVLEARRKHPPRLPTKRSAKKIFTLRHENS